MLKDINNRRPDRQLERNLVFLAYAIMFMSLSVFALFLYPQYSLYIIISMVVWNIVCILVTIRILKVSENAIGFGTLASEIINDRSKYCRIDNSKGEAILINKAAVEYFQNEPILAFLEHNMLDTQANKMDFQKLSSAVNKLQATSVIISVKPQQNSVYVAKEWLKISVKPIYLSKTDIFEREYSLNKIRKEAYLFWLVENITAYKNMDEVFQSEMSSLHHFLDYLPVGLYSCDAGGRIEYINNALAEKLDTDKNDAIGRTIDDFIAYKAEMLHTANGEYSDNIVFKTKGGETEAFVKQANIRDNEELKTRGVVVWDIPNDDILRQKLNLFTDKLEHLFNTVPMGIVLTDKKLQILEINSYATELLGRQNNDLSGQKFSAYLSRDDVKKIIGVLGDKNKRLFGFDTAFKNETSEKSVRISLSKLENHLKTEGGEGEYLLFYIQDTSNRRSLEMQVAQAQKMQAFGQMAGGVAHDFNNLLTAIVGLCDMLLRRHGIGDPSFADLIELKNNVTRAIEIARQLLTVSRKQPLNPKLIDVTEAFADNEHLVSRILGEKIELQVNYGSDLGYIRVDTVQLSQVLLNLAINAKDAMNGEGVLTLAARVEHLDEPYQFGGDIIQPGDFAVLSVKDTGCGIPKENMERIFEPFFSTKKNVLNSGTGLGLSMVYAIVRQMEGFIKVLSEVGKGTTFEIYLPSHEKTEDIEPADKPKEKVILDKTGKVAMTTIVDRKNLTSGEKVVLGLNVTEFDTQRSVLRNPGEVRILFVDDEDAVRIVGARGLRQKGYEVVDCISAENALEHIESGEKFDMMITDMMMPGMSGAELANIMKEKSPQTVIILASGYSEEIARKELAGSQDFYFISKPYGLDDLNKKIKEVLAKL